MTSFHSTVTITLVLEFSLCVLMFVYCDDDHDVENGAIKLKSGTKNEKWERDIYNNFGCFFCELLLASFPGSIVILLCVVLKYALERVKKRIFRNHSILQTSSNSIYKILFSCARARVERGKINKKNQSNLRKETFLKLLKLSSHRFFFLVLSFLYYF